MKKDLNNICGCQGNCLLYMGDYYIKGFNIKDEPYIVNCYYCSICGKELQIYNGYHDKETRKLYEESLKYSHINRSSAFVFDVTKFNSEVFGCSSEEKRSLIYDIKNKNGIGSPAGLQLVLSFKRKK